MSLLSRAPQQRRSSSDHSHHANCMAVSQVNILNSRSLYLVHHFLDDRCDIIRFTSTDIPTKPDLPRLVIHRSPRWVLCLHRVVHHGLITSRFKRQSNNRRAQKDGTLLNTFCTIPTDPAKTSGTFVQGLIPIQMDRHRDVTPNPCFSYASIIVSNNSWMNIERNALNCLEDVKTKFQVRATNRVNNIALTSCKHVGRKNVPR